jgi:hypothetical protein
MKGRLKKIDDKWYVEYTGVSYSGGNPKVLGSYTKKVEKKTLPLLMDSTTFPKDRSNFVIGSRIDFKEVLINPMGREVDPNNLGQNHSDCVWYAKLVEGKEEPKKVLTEEDIWSKEDIDVVTDYINKEQQKQHLIDMMKGDEELGLYDETIDSIKLEEVFGSKHCLYSVIENKLAILYRNQEKILSAIKILNNGGK